MTSTIQGTHPPAGSHAASVQNTNGPLVPTANRRAARNQAMACPLAAAMAMVLPNHGGSGRAMIATTGTSTSPGRRCRPCRSKPVCW